MVKRAEAEDGGSREGFGAASEARAARAAAVAREDGGPKIVPDIWAISNVSACKEPDVS